MRFVSFIFPVILFSQNPTVISKLDTASGFIGDIINWTIKVDRERGQKIRFPNLQNKNTDIIKIKKTNSKKENKTLNQINFEITFWDTGSFFTPDYYVEILNEDGSIDYTLNTKPLEISISSILASSGEKKFRPIKGPVPVKDILPFRQFFLAILLIIIIVVILILWGKREKSIYKKIDYKYTESPYDRAIRRLNELNESGLIKESYTNLSHISREFIENKYFIRTLEMTTPEIEKFRNHFPMSDSNFKSWLEFLLLADEVKYAQKLPKSEILLADKEMIFNLIEEW